MPKEKCPCSRVLQWCQERSLTIIAVLLAALLGIVLLACLSTWMSSHSVFIQAVSAAVTATATLALCFITFRYVRETARQRETAEQQLRRSIMPIVYVDTFPENDRPGFSVPQDTGQVKQGTPNVLRVRNVGFGPSLALKLKEWEAHELEMKGKDSTPWVQAWWANDHTNYKNQATVASSTTRLIASSDEQILEVNIVQGQRPESAKASPIHLYLDCEDIRGETHSFCFEAELDDGGLITGIQCKSD